MRFFRLPTASSDPAIRRRVNLLTLAWIAVVFGSSYVPVGAALFFGSESKWVNVAGSIWIAAILWISILTAKATAIYRGYNEREKVGWIPYAILFFLFGFFWSGAAVSGGCAMVRHEEHKAMKAAPFKPE